LIDGPFTYNHTMITTLAVKSRKKNGRTVGADMRLPESILSPADFHQLVLDVAP
jgi:hypothetical protein